jgi:hypothetical protein
VDEIGDKLHEVLRDLPLAPFAYRRPETAEESKEWDAEGVVVNPPSLDDVIDEAIRRHGVIKEHL